MKFLPDDYQAPISASNYMKIQDGENKIRILSQPVLGWEDWVDKKPVRYRFDQKPAKSHDPETPVRHFWAMIVWNYQEEKIQILQISQATIRSRIEGLSRDEDWGAPYFYDLKIVKTGEKTNTEYQVNPLPHKTISSAVVKAFNEKRCFLEALFEGADPFSAEYDKFTDGVFEKGEQKTIVITKDQVVELKQIFKECPETYVKSMLEHLRKTSDAVKVIEDIPAPLFDRIKNAASKKREEFLLEKSGLDNV